MYLYAFYIIPYWTEINLSCRNRLFQLPFSFPNLQTKFIAYNVVYTQIYYFLKLFFPH